MFCTKCGASNKDDVKFCTTCGSVMEPAAGAAHTAGQTPEKQSDTVAGDPQTNPPEPKAPNKGGRSKAPIAILIAVIAVIVIAIAAVAFAISKTEDQSASTDAAADQAVQVESDQGREVYESALFRIDLPTAVADQLTFTETHNTVSVMYASTGTPIAVLYPQGEKTAGEMAYEDFSLGEVYIDGHYEEARLDLPYIGADGKTLHWSAQGQKELGITRLLDLTPEAFAESISLNTGSTFEPAKLTSLDGNDQNAAGITANATSASSDASKGQGAAAGQGQGAPTEAFWGVWTNAYDNEADASSAAQRISADTGNTAVVVLTTDWENLNSKPWYVVSVGAYPSEDAAKAALERVKGDYPDAYVKYTGAHKQ